MSLKPGILYSHFGDAIGRACAATACGQGGTSWASAARHAAIVDAQGNLAAPEVEKELQRSRVKGTEKDLAGATPKRRHFVDKYRPAIFPWLSGIGGRKLNRDVIECSFISHSVISCIVSARGFAPSRSRCWCRPCSVRRS